jgi:type I restriction enzyme S subunit
VNQVPSNWAISTLGEICAKPQYGWTTKAAETGSVNFLRTSDISRGSIDWEKVPYCDEVPPEVEKYQLKPGDIVISRAGSVGLSALIKSAPRAVFASYLIRFRPSDHVDARYVAYFLQTPNYWKLIESNAVGIAMQNVNAKKLAAIPIPLAPLPEQLRIVVAIETQLTRLDAAVAALKRAQANLKRYRASVLKAAVEGRLVPTEAELARREGRGYESGEELVQKIVNERMGKASRPVSLKAVQLPSSSIRSLPTEGWISASISDFAEVTKLAGFEYTKYVKYDSKGDQPVIKAENVSKSGFIKTSFSRVVSESVSHLKRSELFGDNLLMVFVGVGLGQVARVPTDQKYFLGPNVAVIRVDSRIHSKYLEYFLRSPQGKGNTLTKSKATAQGSISMAQIRTIECFIPPAAEQSRISGEIERRLSIVGAQERTIEVGLIRAERLRQSVLKRAFEGKLVPQDQSDEPANILLEQIHAGGEIGASEKFSERQYKQSMLLGTE